MSESLDKIKVTIEDAYNNGNLDRLNDIYDPNAVRHTNSTRDLIGLDAIKKAVANMQQANPDMSFSLDEVFEVGDKRAIRWVQQGTNTATGKVWRNTGSAICHLVDGKVIEEWNSFDLLGMFQQLGLVAPTEELTARNS